MKCAHLDALSKFPGPRLMSCQPALDGHIVADSVVSHNAARGVPAAGGHKKRHVWHRQSKNVHAERREEDQVHRLTAGHVGHERVVRGGHAHRPGRRDRTLTGGGGGGQRMGKADGLLEASQRFDVGAGLTYRR